MFLILSCAGHSAETPLTNQLAENTSAYLAMHAADPVQWQLWNQQTFAHAQREGKLLFVSSGYFSCHWCHVMQRESFRNARIAALINRDFIPVKIDKQMLPAVDAKLMDFTQRTRGQGGWPLNVFVTPGGYPLLGSLYLPADEFERLLKRLDEHWKANQASLTAMARSVAQTPIATESSVEADISSDDVSTSDALWAQLRDDALRYADELQGGFGTQAKFPMAPQLLVLLQAYQREPNPVLGEFLRLTLRQMADQGLQDQLGGGFFRYTTDPDWHTPHFEKMLYDNALLARVYLQAARLFNAPEFLVIARRTLDFVLDTLPAPGGGYYAALSAVDAAGVEGGDYLWDRAEIKALTGQHWPLVQRYWGLDRAASFEAGYLPLPMRTSAQLATEFNLPVAEVDAILTSVRERLLQRRAQRQAPIDTQILAGWNGLLLWALADAVEIIESGKARERYTRAAQTLQDVLLGQFRIEGELVRARRGSTVESAATLEDYAYVASGLLRWQAVSDSKARTAGVQLLVEQAWKKFFSAGRWSLGEETLLQWGQGSVVIADGPMPSPPALLLSASRQAEMRTEQTVTALRAALPLVQADPFNYASYVALYP
jgi:uncharacterized protein YyaL (SSP411 family)